MRVVEACPSRVAYSATGCDSVFVEEKEMTKHSEKDFMHEGIFSVPHEVLEYCKRKKKKCRCV
jgi:hypothetical protein